MTQRTYMHRSLELWLCINALIAGGFFKILWRKRKVQGASCAPFPMYTIQPQRNLFTCNYARLRELPLSSPCQALWLRGRETFYWWQIFWVPSKFQVDCTPGTLPWRRDVSNFDIPYLRTERFSLPEVERCPIHNRTLESGWEHAKSIPVITV